VYPTVVARTPGCFRRDSDGSQKQPMPNVASRTAKRDVVLLTSVTIVVVDEDVDHDCVGAKARVDEAWLAKTTNKLIANASFGDILTR